MAVAVAVAWTIILAAAVAVVAAVAVAGAIGLNSPMHRRTGAVTDTRTGTRTGRPNSIGCV